MYAWNSSDDPITKTGAIIVNSTLDEIIAYGTNHFPEGLNPTQEQIKDRKWRHENIIHAETSAIFYAAKEGESTKGAVMYMPWIPCTPCAQAIIDSGIKKLIGHKEMIMKTPKRWQENIDYALNLLKKGNVKNFMYDGKLDGVKSLFNSSEWYP